MPEKKVIKIGNIGLYGVIRQAEVDDQLIPDGAVVEAVNVNFDRKGAVQLRPGYEDYMFDSIDIEKNAKCYGLVAGQFFSTTKLYPLAVFSKSGSQSIYLYKSTVSTWSVSLTGDTANKETNFLIFGDGILKVNGSNSMAVFITGGASGTWQFAGGQLNPDDMAGIPTKYLDAYKSRVYTAGYSTYPYRLYYSSVISSTGLITWSPTTDYVDINPSDGEKITAIKRYGTELLVFKPSYIYRFRTSGVDPDPLIKIGTDYEKSIIEGKKGLYFFHSTGIYRYSGAIPENISKPISDILYNILESSESFTSWTNQDYIYWSIIGSYYKDSYNNSSLHNSIVLRYTESSDVWTVYQYDRFFKCSSYAPAIGWILGDTNVAEGDGPDASGSIWLMWDSLFSRPSNDYGNPIPYYFVTKWYSFGSIADQKLIKRMVAYCEKAQGSKVYYQIDEDDHWNELGQLTKFMTDFDQLNIRFHRIRFKLRGISSSEPFIFKGLEIIDYENEGPVKLN